MYILKIFLKIPPLCCALLPRACPKSEQCSSLFPLTVSPWGQRTVAIVLHLESYDWRPTCHSLHWRPDLGYWMQDSNPQGSVLLGCPLLNFVFTFCSLSTQQTNRQESYRFEPKEQASVDPGIWKTNILASKATVN